MNTSLAARVLQRAAHEPDRTAVELPRTPAAPGRTLAYGALADAARDLAAALHRRGARPGDTVALVAASVPELVVALLATAGAGLVCAPLDDAQPPARVRSAMRVAGAAIALVASPERAAYWLAELGEQAVEVGTGPRRADAGQAPAFPVPVAADDPAYLLFTSGSTGVPKGVRVAHGPFARHCEVAAEAYGLTPDSVTLQFASPGFDVALEEIWPTLLSGGRVVLRGGGLWSLPELLDVTAAHGITMWQLPTAYWTLLGAEAAVRGDLRPPPSLDTVLIGGEAATTAAARRWLGSPMGAVRLLNAYGPTEGVVTSTLYEVPREAGALPPGEILPIGRPLPGRSVLVLDEELRPAPPGSPGELFVTGPCLADGYAGDAAATTRAFPTLPDGRRAFRTGDLATGSAGGVLVYHGRRDRQLKISGVRVEPGEVEAALADCAGVTAAAVTVAGEGDRSRLVAHVVLAEPPADPARRAGALRGELAGRLPAAMVPARVEFHDRLPRTVNDKVDHHALAAPARTESEGSR
ncbi:amino acid adenylation domain-containing protein [Streptomyces sp. NPDC048270]|uniref:amino acid adenylation domain-containing protein n=1 Tax=Streptomyces sp. NPDC048270 TaxID=3154615 RepID=UPI0033E257A8